MPGLSNAKLDELERAIEQADTGRKRSALEEVRADLEQIRADLVAADDLNDAALRDLSRLKQRSDDLKRLLSVSSVVPGEIRSAFDRNKITSESASSFLDLLDEAEDPLLKSHITLLVAECAYEQLKLLHESLFNRKSPGDMPKLDAGNDAYASIPILVGELMASFPNLFQADGAEDYPSLLVESCITKFIQDQLPRALETVCHQLAQTWFHAATSRPPTTPILYDRLLLQSLLPRSARSLPLPDHLNNDDSRLLIDTLQQQELDDEQFSKEAIQEMAQIRSSIQSLNDEIDQLKRRANLLVQSQIQSLRVATVGK